MQTESVVKKVMSQKKRMICMVITLLFSYILMLGMAAIKIFAVSGAGKGVESAAVFIKCASVMFGIFVTFIVYGYMSGWHVDMTLRKFFAMNAALLLGYVLCLLIEMMDPYYMPVIFTAFCS